jgi:DNA-binding IclR family transcriptional regulator
MMNRGLSSQGQHQTVHGTQVLARALAVLDAVRRGCADLASIGRETGTSKSTTHRLVLFLQRNGLLRYTEGRGYCLGPKLVELGAAALDQMPLTSVARPHLERLSQQTGDTVHLSVRDGDVIIYMDKISGSRGLEMRSRVGRQSLMATTGTGKAMMLDLAEEEWAHLYSLAHSAVILADVPPPGFLAWDAYREVLREYRAKGYTMEFEETEGGIHSVGAPIRNAQGHIVAAVSIASTVPYMPRERMQALIPVVMACASSISTELGYSISSLPASH